MLFWLKIRVITVVKCEKNDVKQSQPRSYPYGCTYTKFGKNLSDCSQDIGGNKVFA